MSYVIRRENRYHYRRRFPADVAEIVGRAEFRKALGTADRKDAEKQARIVSVEFDRICSESLAQSVREAPGEAVGAQAGAPQRVSSETILARLRDVVARSTRSAIEALEPTQRVAASWPGELEWMKAAWLATAKGEHPAAAHYNQLEAMAAYRALEALERGELTSLGTITPESSPLAIAPSGAAGDPATSTAAEFKEALDSYCARVSPSRAGIVRGLAKRVLHWPSSQAQQVGRIMQYAEAKLAAGLKPSSVYTQTAGLITVLRELPGWEQISLPRNGSTARIVRQGGQLQADARDSMPLAIVQEVLAGLDSRGDKVDAAAARLLVRYGLRPKELLQEGPDALAERQDILGGKELVFHAGLSGAKNSASRRCLPVHADDVELFKLVLSARGVGGERRARARIQRLSAAVRRLVQEKPGRLSLYSLRHTCADLLRAAGATPDEVGGVLGHAAKGSKATSIYGGMAPLDRPRELLANVRKLLQASGGQSAPRA